MTPRLPRRSVLACLAVGASVLSASSGQSTPPAVAGLTQYTFGTPSGDETEILAEINRARANPPADGQRLVNEMNALYPNGTSGVDLATLLAQFQSYPARPPLAFNAKLNAAAQSHLPEMVKLGYYTHNSPDGETPVQRVGSFGYSIFAGENVAGSASYPFNVLPAQTEDNYEIDSTEPGYGHRLNILEPNNLGNVEAGVAQQPYGGWSVEDFGGDYTPTLLTGAVFTDNAGTGLYVSGEGVASVVVTAPGASSFYAATVESGAYTLPLDLLTFNAAVPNPTVQVVFTDALGNVTAKAVTLNHTVFSFPEGGSSTYWDASGNVRYDNAEACLVEPATAGLQPAPTPTPMPAPSPTMPLVTVTAEQGSQQFVVSRTGDTGGALAVTYLVKGSAVAGQDYMPLPGTKKIKAGKSTAKITVHALAGARGTLKLTLVPSANAYGAPAPAQAKLHLSDAD